MQLARHHRARAVGEPIAVRYEGDDLEPERLEQLVEAAGLAGGVVQRALPDTVGPDMAVLLVGLNPSLHAADRGYAFAGPGNRFWPAAVEAGLVTAAHDSHRALLVDRVGMTDLVKRPTGTAGDLAGAEYRAGLPRIEWLCEWLTPAAVCFVGLTGYRAACGAGATAGWQADRLGGSPVYVMPNPSGLNARTSRSDLAAHFRTLRGGCQSPPTTPTGQDTPVPPRPQ
jgi:TDG/mug DNA glycosylase family protein